MVKPPARGVLARKLAAQALEGRARLYHWMRLRYSELAKAKAELRFSWKDLAKVVGDAGARDAFDERPNTEAVRKAFLKLERDMKAGQERLNALDCSAATLPPQSKPKPYEEPGPHRFQRKPVAMRGVPKSKKEG